MSQERYHTSQNTYFNSFTFFKVAFTKHLPQGEYLSMKKYDPRKEKTVKEAVIFFDEPQDFNSLRTKVRNLVNAEIPQKMPGDVYEFRLSSVNPTENRRFSRGSVRFLRFTCNPKVVSPKTINHKVYRDRPRLTIKMHVNTLLDVEHFTREELEELAYMHDKRRDYYCFTGDGKKYKTDAGPKLVFEIDYQGYEII